MPFDVAKAIESIGKAAESGFSYAEKSKESQSETAILKDRDNLQKAVNVSEKIILLTYRYYSQFTKADQKEFNMYVEKFLKYN